MMQPSPERNTLSDLDLTTLEQALRCGLVHPDAAVRHLAEELAPQRKLTGAETREAYLAYGN